MVALTQVWPLRVLTPRHVEDFVRDGFVMVREVFAPETAARLLPAVWDRLAEDRDDPCTWRQKGVQIEEVIEEGPVDLLFTERFRSSVDDLVGEGRWTTRRGYGWVVLRFPGFSRPPWQAPSSGWHVDGIHFHHRLCSPEQGLVGIELLTDIAPGGGGTALRVGSQRVVSRALADAEPDGLSYAQLRALAEQIDDLPVVEAAGRAGDVLWMHPHLAHARSPNVGDRIRIASNRCIALKQAMAPLRPGHALSPVEQSIVQALRP